MGLTKVELAALYQSAVAKGETLKLDTGDESYIHAAVHEIDESGGHHFDPQPNEYETHQSFEGPEHVSATTEEGDDSDGYYYYYYPLKAFIDELSSQPSSVSRESMCYVHLHLQVNVHFHNCSSIAHITFPHTSISKFS